MKIAFIVHDYHRHGGHARYVAELASRFKKEHEVHVYANRWEETDPVGLTFHKVPAWTWREITKVLSFILPATWNAPKNFDIVHSQGLCGLRHDLTTTHFIQPAWFRELKKRNQKSGLGSLFWTRIVAPLERFALGPLCSQRVISISHSVTTDLNREYGINQNVDLIYHGTDLTKFHPLNQSKYRNNCRENLGFAYGDFVALFVGNLQKGAAVAIQAVSKVPDCHLVLVSGSNNLREVEIAANLGISHRIHWVPLSREIEIYFAAADCFVFPTVYEPFGMVISEAMASGLPVITSKSAGAAELIEHGKSGLLLNESWSAAEISKNLVFLMQNSDLRIDMGVAARRAIEPYTWDRCAEETMSVYQKIVDNKKKHFK